MNQLQFKTARGIHNERLYVVVAGKTTANNKIFKPQNEQWRITNISCKTYHTHTHTISTPILANFLYCCTSQVAFNIFISVSVLCGLYAFTTCIMRHFVPFQAFLHGKQYFFWHCHWKKNNFEIKTTKWFQKKRNDTNEKNEPKPTTQTTEIKKIKQKYEK